MKMHYKTGSMMFEIEGASPKDLFKKVATIQEIFDTDKSCGACQSQNIRFSARQVDDFEFFEIRCDDCSARLQFGQLKKGGGLFVKRRDEDGHLIANRGWEKYEPKKSSAPAPKQDLRDNRVDDDDIPF